MSLRNIIIKRIRAKFFRHLRRGPLRGWSVSLLYDFSKTIVDKNRQEIFRYLDDKSVTVDNIEKVTDEIIKKILIPYLEKIEFGE